MTGGAFPPITMDASALFGRSVKFIGSGEPVPPRFGTEPFFFAFLGGPVHHPTSRPDRDSGSNSGAT